MATKNYYSLDYERIIFDLKKINVKKMCEDIGIRQNSLNYALKNKSLDVEWLGKITGYLNRPAGFYFTEIEQPTQSVNEEEIMYRKIDKVTQQANTISALMEQVLDELSKMKKK